MKIRCVPALIALLSTTGLCSNSLAADLEVSRSAAANLGITLIAPQRTDQLSTISAMARVVIPPVADRAVSARHAGTVAQLHVAAGDRVAVGAPLVDLVSSAFLTLQRDYLDALGQHALAAATRQRDEQLLTEGIISERRLNESRTRAAEARLALAEHRQLLVLSGLSDDQLQVLERSRELLSVLTIRAPTAGDIIERWIGVGDQLEPGMRLLRLADLTRLWLEIQVPAEQLERLAPGFVVSRNVAGRPRTIARVAVTTRAVDPESQKALVRAATITDEHGLLPGQQIEILIHIPASSNELWQLPLRAITRVGDQSYLFLATASGFRAVPVTVHGSSGESSYVEAPLTADSRIALTGIAALKSIWLTAEESP